MICQRVYQLLPPPYRDCWLDWQEVEDKLKAATKEEENKPREQYISKLMKKLKVSEEEGRMEEEEEEVQTEKKEEMNEEEEVGDTWEDLASDEVRSVC